MDPALVLLVVLTAMLTAAVVGLAVSLRRRQTAETQTVQAAVDRLRAELVGAHLEGLATLRSSLDAAARGLNERLAEGTSAMDRRLTVVAEIEHRLGELQRQTQNLEDIGRNIQALSDLLKPPKLRGGLGELLLENLLGQILPPALYAMQHGFRDGSRVDAVIRLGDRFLPVDSKFPLDAFARLSAESAGEAAAGEFQRAVKVQIDAIAAKYIRPDEQTTDFAVMYVPSEAVYARLISDEGGGLLPYALARRVIPSSPGHLYAFLASVAAIYREAGLAGNTRRLSVVVSGVRAALERLDRTHERMAGSTRMLALNLDKARAEAGAMKELLDRVHGPDAAEPAEDNPAAGEGRIK